MRMEQFEYAGRMCYRKEVESWPPVEVTVKKTPTREGRRWKGRHLLVLGDQEYDVDLSLLGDRGPKLGIAVNMQEHQETPPSPEVLAELDRRLVEAATQALIHAGIW